VFGKSVNDVEILTHILFDALPLALFSIPQGYRPAK
jgi:hypothetical protein